MTSDELLVITADEHLRSSVDRLAAAAGASPLVVGRASDALARWAIAATVLVGEDMARSVASLGPPRREGVHLVGLTEPPLRDALACSAESVLVLPAESDRLVELLTDSGSSGHAVTVGVVGGAGGVGGTVFASALAGACSARGPTVLVDADRLGAGVDEVLGLDPDDGIRWDALLGASGRLGARALRESLPRWRDLAVLAWPRHPPEVDTRVAREVLSAARRGFEAVVFALPRHPDLLGDELVLHCDRLLLVTTRTVPAVMAAERVLARLPPKPISLVLRGRGLGSDQVSDHLGLPVTAAMVDQRGLDEALSLGAGPLRRRGPLVRAADEVASALWSST